MKNKILISTFFLLVITAFLCSYSFANNMLQSAGNTIKNAENAIGNAASQTGNTIVNGTRNLIDDAGNLGNNAMNEAQNMTNDAMNQNQNTNNDTSAIYDTNNDDYTAQRTAAGNTGLFGMSDTMSTWLILGIVGVVIVSLIWYYSSQYEHRHNTND